MLKPEEKKEIIQEHKMHEADTGSAAVQIGLINEEINRLLEHLKGNPKDLHSKRGLLKMISKRRSLLKYLKLEDGAKYLEIIKKMGLKK